MAEAPTDLLKFKKESNTGKKYSLEIKALNEYLSIHIISEEAIPSFEYEKKCIYRILKIIDIFLYVPISKNFFFL